MEYVLRTRLKQVRRHIAFQGSKFLGSFKVLIIKNFCRGKRLTKFVLLLLVKRVTNSLHFINRVKKYMKYV